jgi:2'-5' RNA ligase
VFARLYPTPVGFGIDEFVLMHSQLNPTGSIYTRAATFSLG